MVLLLLLLVLLLWLMVLLVVADRIVRADCRQQLLVVECLLVLQVEVVVDWKQLAIEKLVLVVVARRGGADARLVVGGQRGKERLAVGVVMARARVGRRRRRR